MAPKFTFPTRIRRCLPRHCLGFSMHKSCTCSPVWATHTEPVMGPVLTITSSRLQARARRPHLHTGRNQRSTHQPCLLLPHNPPHSLGQVRVSPAPSSLLDCPFSPPKDTPQARPSPRLLPARGPDPASLVSTSLSPWHVSPSSQNPLVAPVRRRLANSQAQKGAVVSGAG